MEENNWPLRVIGNVRDHSYIIFNGTFYNKGRYHYIFLKIYQVSIIYLCKIDTINTFFVNNTKFKNLLLTMYRIYSIRIFNGIPYLYRTVQ